MSKKMKTLKTDEFQLATRKFSKFVKALTTDTKFFRQNASYPLNDTMRRAYVRSVFSMIDGVISTIKKELLLEYDIGNDETLSTRELHILESRIRVQGKYGSVTERPFYAPLAEDVKVTFRFFAYFSLVEHYLDEESRGWKRFIKAIAIRNRITHPKTANALEISDEDLAIVDSARAWFVRNVALIYQKIGASFLAQAKALRRARPLNDDQKGHGYLINLGEQPSGQLDLFASHS
jgi:hypothetical protein